MNVTIRLAPVRKNVHVTALPNGRLRYLPPASAAGGQNRITSGRPTSTHRSSSRVKAGAGSNVASTGSNARSARSSSGIRLLASC
jgi:hypothetical protein